LSSIKPLQKQGFFVFSNSLCARWSDNYEAKTGSCWWFCWFFGFSQFIPFQQVSNSHNIETNLNYAT